MIDSSIKTDLVSIFDYTFNQYSKDALISLFSAPLADTAQILERQEILKGFIDNAHLLQYHYAYIDFQEVFHFLTGPEVKKINTENTILFTFNKRLKLHLQSRVSQAVTFFNTLYQNWFKKLRLLTFPPVYKTEVENLIDFFVSLEIEPYSKSAANSDMSSKQLLYFIQLIKAKNESGELRSFFDRLYRFEAYISVAIAIQKRGFVFPAFSESTFQIDGLYHPELSNPVRNSFQLHQPVFLLTGPNMSGKSTFLKSVGICVYLAHLGLAVPASRAILPTFDYIALYINHTDNLGAGHSHFMNELMQLKRLLLQANENKKCFAAFDELFKSTNMEDANILMAETVKGLGNFPGCIVLISTHLDNITNEANTQNCYLECILQDNTPLFTFQLKNGWSNLHIGKQLFDAAGLPALLNK